MSQDKEKILERIRKCLRLSKSSNEHEAALALGHAQKLMQQHQLQEADLIAGQAYSRTANYVRPAKWESALAMVVTESMGCRLVFFRGIWKFFGCMGAEKVAQYAFEVLRRQLRRARKTHIETQLTRCQKKGKTQRADAYCMGWVLAVRKNVERLWPTPEQQAAIKAVMEKGLSRPMKQTTISTAVPKTTHKSFAAGQHDGAVVRLKKPLDGHATAQIGYAQ